MSATIPRFVNLRRERSLFLFRPKRYPIYDKSGKVRTKFDEDNNPIDVTKGGGDDPSLGKRRPASAVDRLSTKRTQNYRGWLISSARSIREMPKDREWVRCKNPFLTKC